MLRASKTKEAANLPTSDPPYLVETYKELKPNYAASLKVSIGK